MSLMPKQMRVINFEKAKSLDEIKKLLSDQNRLLQAVYSNIYNDVHYGSVAVGAESDPVFLASAAHDITFDGGGNMVFTDSVVGARTLKQLGCPTYKYLSATNQSAGDLHLSGAGWAVSKAWILSIRVITVATNWNLYILQNDNGYAANDADYPRVKFGPFSGNAIIKVNDCYEDEDGSDEVHLYYDGASSATIIIKAIELL